jgi:hypothetical protein
VVGCLPVFAVNDSKALLTRTLFTGTASAITGSGSITSAPIEIKELHVEGYFSFMLTTVGAGSSVKVEYLFCDTIDGTYLEPDGADDIVAAHLPGSAFYATFPCKGPGNYMKIKITETNGANVTSTIGKITIQ